MVKSTSGHPLQHTRRSMAECYSPWWSDATAITSHMTLMMNNTGMQRCASSRRDYRNILWCKGCYFWHIATSGEKLGQSRLSIRTRRQRQTTSESHHRLPAEQRVTCKITTLTFKVLSSSTPMLYLSKLIQAAIPVQPPQLSDAPLLSSREHKLNLLGGH